MSSSSKVPSLEEIRGWGVSTTVENAGRCLRQSRTQAYASIHRGDFPIPVVHVGRKIIVPVAPLLRLLGLDEPPVVDDAQTPLRLVDEGAS